MAQETFRRLARWPQCKPNHPYGLKNPASERNQLGSAVSKTRARVVFSLRRVCPRNAEVTCETGLRGSARVDLPEDVRWR